MDNSSFFAVNLYSRSIFGNSYRLSEYSPNNPQFVCCISIAVGEDALANVSIEKLSGGKLAGNVRIRSRSQVGS